MKLSSLSGKPFKVLGLKDPDGFVVGSVEHADKDWLVTLKLAKDPKPPRGKVQILTDRKDQESIEVAYTVKMAGGPPGPGMPMMMPRHVDVMKSPPPGMQPMMAPPQLRRLPPPPNTTPPPPEPPKK